MGAQGGAMGHPQFGTVESSQYHSQMGAGNLGAYGDMGQAFNQGHWFGIAAEFHENFLLCDNDWWNNPAPLQSQRGGASHGGDALGAAPSQFGTLESASQYPTQMGTGAPGYGGAYGDMGQGHGPGHDQWAQQGGGGYGAYGSQGGAPRAMGGHDQWSQQGGYGQAGVVQAVPHRLTPSQLVSGWQTTPSRFADLRFFQGWCFGMGRPYQGIKGILDDSSHKVEDKVKMIFMKHGIPPINKALIKDIVDLIEHEADRSMV
ncbi:hypothetical protein AK812_SmicGene921 [Symbiodinium microadriaticum]|uniref:Uncharacterized protein n=1 Tax=Symbiodinium microadriaticum TaxID=2951 RepID=A0A1Q9F5N8_SYMMI|nr:hypothetical protein AK812_SmicGene921 [Symbiodinium microadriaticum]